MSVEIITSNIHVAIFFVCLCPITNVIPCCVTFYSHLSCPSLHNNNTKFFLLLTFSVFIVQWRVEYFRFMNHLKSNCEHLKSYRILQHNSISDKLFRNCTGQQLRFFPRRTSPLGEARQEGIKSKSSLAASKTKTFLSFFPSRMVTNFSCEEKTGTKVLITLLGSILAKGSRSSHHDIKHCFS